MASEEPIMDYDTLKNMKVPELKDFLRLRGLKVTGKKCELVARAFAAMENHVPISNCNSYLFLPRPLQANLVGTLGQIYLKI